MKLLLDEMYPSALAEALRDSAIDAIAVDEHEPLRGLSDEELLSRAAGDKRAVVTENVSDFMRLAGEWAAAGRQHSGIIIALSSRFARSPAGHDTLVASLADLCSTRPADDALRNGIHFLARADGPTARDG